jgi:hypothetical protein
MRILIAGLVLVAMMASAQAQMSPQQSQMNAAGQVGQHAANSANKLDSNDASKAKANDKAYGAALKNLPDKQFDPWRGVR